MILKISSRAKVGVPKTLVKQKLRLQSLYLVQNTLMFTESRGEFSNLHSIFRLRALRYCAAQTIQPWQSNSSTGNTPVAIKTLFPWQLLFSSPHPLDFNMLVIFRSKIAKGGHKRELTYLYGTLKVARNAFNIGEVWNQVCCHGNKTVKLILLNTFRRILPQKIKHF